MSLSKHFSVHELEASDTASRLGLDNTPTPRVIGNAVRLAETVLEPIREHFGPYRTFSWYRSVELNKSIPGSSNTSLHTFGCAQDGRPVDLSIPLSSVMSFIIDNLDFDEVIYEYGRWVHVAVAKSWTTPQRKKTLMKFKGSKYLPWDAGDSRVV